MSHCPQEIGWSTPRMAMDALRCSGFPPLAIWVAIFSVAICVTYFLIAREWRRPAPEQGEAAAALVALVWVFAVCGISGYVFDAVACFGSVGGTIAWWGKAITRPPLLVAACQAAWNIHRYGAGKLVADLGASNQARGLLTAIHGEESLEGIRRRVAELRSQLERGKQ